MQVRKRALALLLTGVMSASVAMTGWAVDSPSKSNTVVVRRSSSGGGSGSGGGGSVSGSSAAGGATSSGASTTSRPNTEGSWVQHADGTWGFVGPNGAYTGWIVSGNQWYMLDENGNMLTGWQLVNGVYYYFSTQSVNGQPTGSLLMNTTTPDGYKVGANGEYIAS